MPVIKLLSLSARPTLQFSVILGLGIYKLCFFFANQFLADGFSQKEHRMETGKHKGRKTCSLLLLVIAIRIVSTKNLMAAADSSSSLFVFLAFPELVSQSSFRGTNISEGTPLFNQESQFHKLQVPQAPAGQQLLFRNLGPGTTGSFL